MKKNLIYLLLMISIHSLAQRDTMLRSAFSKSYTLENSKQYEKASLELKNVYSENGYEINLRLGWLCYQAGQYMESIGYYEKSVALHPQSIEARLGLVYPLSVQNKWDDVLAQYKSILGIDPQNSAVNYRTALIYYNRKNFSEAKKHLDTILNLYPFDYDSNLLLGWTRYSLEDKAGAEMNFNTVLLYNPRDTSAAEGMRLCKL